MDNSTPLAYCDDREIGRTPTLPRLLLTEEEAARAIGFTARFLQARRLSGDGPPYIRISARAVRYRPEDIDAWAKSLRRTSTSDTGREAA